MIEIKNLTKLYKNNKGIKNATFTIEKNDIVGLIGDNGAGKSTIIKSIFSEIKKSEGDILYLGNKLDLEGLKDFSFFPDQNGYPKNISVLKFCIYAAQLSGMSYKNAKAKSLRLLHSLFLNEYKDKTFKVLSSGMQKRALLCFCLVTDPKVIFLDEPTANLDVKTRIEFINLLKELNKQGITILIASHIIDELQELINKVIIIDKGEIVYENKFEKNENLKNLYFKVTKNSQSTINVEELINIKENR